MPFTFAHPAAAIPLRRCLGRVAVPSALVIGSVMPDCPYFLIFSMPRAMSHSLPALFWYCVPVGLALYLVFHLFVKLPLISLMPAVLANRLAAVVAGPRLPAVPWWHVLLSLLVGAVSHLLWDAFTHGGGAAVRTFTSLRTELFALGNYHMLVFKLLQHASTILGMAALVVWIVDWIRRTPAHGMCPISLSRRARAGCVALILAVTAVAALWSALAIIVGRTVTVSLAQDAVGEATINGITALGAAIIAFSALWHALVRREVYSPLRHR